MDDNGTVVKTKHVWMIDTSKQPDVLTFAKAANEEHEKWLVSTMAT